MEISAPSLDAFFQNNAAIKAPKFPVLNTIIKFRADTTELNIVAMVRIINNTMIVIILDARFIFSADISV